MCVCVCVCVCVCDLSIFSRPPLFCPRVAIRAVLTLFPCRAVFDSNVGWSTRECAPGVGQDRSLPSEIRPPR